MGMVYRFPYQHRLLILCHHLRCWISPTNGHKEHYTDYRFEANDSTFTLTMTKSTQEFDILYHGKGYDLGYCRGTYTTTGNNEYILEVDSNLSSQTSDRRFFIKNDSIINFKGNDTKIKLKKTFF